jgi:MSHA biogenesis protein MshQ
MNAMFTTVGRFSMMAVVWVGLLVIAQSAHANRTINSVTLNNASSVSVVPGDFVTLVVNVTTDATGGGSNPTRWRGTGWRISATPPGALTCWDNTNFGSAGTYSANTTIQVPATPGTYNAYFVAYTDNGCSTDPSATHVLTGGVVVVGPQPAVTSINRGDFNPARAGYPVSWNVLFNTPVTGVDATDFALIQTGGASGASITSVTGSGTTYTVTASTGTAGTLGLNLVDNDSIVSGSTALGGAGAGNGNFPGQIYTLLATVCNGAADILFCDDFERSNPGSLGNGWTITPANAGNCSGTTGNRACAGIDSDIPPFNTYANPRPNPSRAMFTRWAVVSVDSKVVDLSVATGAQLSFWIRRGRDTFSECPEASGENYLVQYYASNNTWKTLAQYPSSPTATLCDGKMFTPTIELPPDALHAGFKMRFYQPSGSGDSGSGGAAGVRGYDYWHMDDIVIRKVTSPTYVGAFCDNFEAGLSRWSISAENYSSGSIGDATISSLAYQSPNHELDMRWGYVTASTFKTNLTGISGNITFWVKSGNGTLDPATGQNLVVEYLNNLGVWTELKTYLGTLAGGTVDSFTVALPTDAKHAGFRLRFRQVAGGGYDKSYWHIDDVCVGSAVATSDMGLTKTGDTTLIPGTNTSYTLKATNNGPDAMSGALQVVDTLPSGLSYLSGGGSGWTCSANGQIVTCNWPGTLANGAVAPDLVIAASVGAGVTGSLTNTAVLSSTGSDPASGNNTASFTSGNFIPYFIFTNGPCVDGIAIGQSGQTCSVVSWTSMVAGQPKTGIHITAVNASSVPTKLSSSASTTVSTQFGLTCHDPIANAGVQATFTATAAALQLCTGNGADPTSWSTATSLTFLSGAPSVATSYTFTYADVGEVELFMRNSVATSQVGKSGHFVVRPAGFVLTEIKPTDTSVSGRCALPTTACANAAFDAITFVRAGEAFTATVKAVTTTGAVAPNFGNEISPESVVLTPDNVVVGMVSPPDVVGAFGTFSGGIATGVEFSWGEVGIITLTPSIQDGDYLGTGNVAGTTSANVGRFIPNHFDTVVNQVSGVPIACPDGLCPATFNGIVYSGKTFSASQPISYAGQPFSLTVTAKNANGTTTANYNTTTGFSKVTALAPFASLGTATVTSPVGALGVASVTAFTAGTLTEASETYSFTTTPNIPINIYINASDGEASSRRTNNPTTTSIEGGVRVVSGRINIPNMYGSELLALPITATVQYYKNATEKWVTSLTDSVTSFSSALAPTGNLVASNASCAMVKTPDTAPVAVSAGVRNLVFSRVAVTAPAPKCITTFSINAPSYLPSATGSATFGIYKSPLIYRRENY